MYQVYADDILIYDSVSPSLNVKLTSPKLILQDNASGSFEMTISPDNPGYSSIQHRTTTIIVKKDGSTIWTGRALTEDEDFWKNKHIVCEGALCFLNDSIQELVHYNSVSIASFLGSLLNVHNSKVAASRQIQIGTVTVTEYSQYSDYTTSYENTSDVIQTNFLDRLDGHMRIRYGSSSNTPILDYLSDYPNRSSQEINFGNNLLDFTKNWDVSELVTVILPLGAKSEDEDEYGYRDSLTIESVNNNSKYLANSDAVSTYGRIEKIVEFSDVEDVDVLYEMANTYLSSLQFDNMTLEVSAIDLHYLNPSIVGFNLLDEVRCVSKPHGLDKIFPITKIEIPLDSPENVMYTLGATQPASFTQSSSVSNRAVSSSINNIDNTFLASAKAQAASIINSFTTGYVNIVTEGDVSQALIISNTPDVETANKLWRFNMGGLGYSSNGGTTYDVAITMDGSIVGNHVKTGIISDGVGRNFWNLDTGEFQLAYNTEFVNGNNSITIGDVATLAYNAGSLAEDAYYGASGGDNLLRGVSKNHAILDGNTSSSWSNATWDGKYGLSGTDGVSKSVVAAENVTGISKPNADIPSYDKFVNNTISRVSSNSAAYIAQRNVPLDKNTVYTLSCYAMKTSSSSASKLTVVVGTDTYITAGTDEVARATSTLTNSWKRYSFTFKMVSDLTEARSSNQLVGSTSNSPTVSVLFGAILDASDTVYLGGLKLERGNLASDWSWNSSDSEVVNFQYTREYSNAIKEASFDYTDSSIGQVASDLSTKIGTAYSNAVNYTDDAKTYVKNYFTDTEILKRLTNNGARKGLFLKNGELYINATYLRSGSISADMVRAGIIRDSLGYSSWNLDTGILKTNYLTAINANVAGTFTSEGLWNYVGSNYGYKRLTVYYDAIQGDTATSPSKNYRWAGYLKFGAGTYGNDGTILASNGNLIFAPSGSIYTGRTNSTGVVTEKVKAYSGIMEIPYWEVEKTSDYTQWTRKTKKVQIFNGFIVGIS